MARTTRAGNAHPREHALGRQLADPRFLPTQLFKKDSLPLAERYTSIRHHSAAHSRAVCDFKGSIALRHGCAGPHSGGREWRGVKTPRTPPMGDCWSDCLQVITCGIINYGKQRPRYSPFDEPLLSEGSWLPTGGYPAGTGGEGSPPRRQVRQDVGSYLGGSRRKSAFY